MALAWFNGDGDDADVVSVDATWPAPSEFSAGQSARADALADLGQVQTERWLALDVLQCSVDPSLVWLLDPAPSPLALVSDDAGLWLMEVDGTGAGFSIAGPYRRYAEGRWFFEGSDGRSASWLVADVEAHHFAVTVGELRAPTEPVTCAIAFARAD